MQDLYSLLFVWYSFELCTDIDIQSDLSYKNYLCMISLLKVAVRVRPLNGAEVEDKNCTEIVHVLDENVSISC